ncbi:hypothetical protein [Anaerosolibacter sp.]|jgi:hypothetical protein|uniref:hypothetical protein n=1 Tax=Anaerosolibacter sp. TaxID=1872527 RepID=UPI0026051027|nr:hypothetical protein [Anaerosolibacter sp.]MDF2546679.1 hypothetical protein [Anaerosolibacter sp.]
MGRKCPKTPTAVSPMKAPMKAPMERVPVFYPEPPHYNPTGNEYDYVPRKYSVDQYMKTSPAKADKHGCAASKKR